MREETGPVLATPKETREILAAVIKGMRLADMSSPPSGQSAHPGSALAGHLILSDRSICISEKTNKLHCELSEADILLHRTLDTLAPLQLRQEFVTANRVSREIDLKGIAGTQVVRGADIDAIFAAEITGSWRKFNEKFPGGAGFVEISRPVLTGDRRQALIYISHHCGGLCGTGTIHLLERTPAGWRVSKQEMLWIS